MTFYPFNDELGLHTHMAVIELLSRATGEPLALMDGRLITEMRTAAVSAVALDALAPEGVRSLGIFGSGVQARSHLEALRRVRPGLKEVRIWSRTEANARKLAEECGGQLATREETAGCDVVLTVTSAAAPVLEGRWLKPDAVVLAVGATGTTMRELDDEAMRSCFIAAECRGAAKRESGDVRGSGVRVAAEVGELAAGKVTPAEGRRLFKSVGMAIEDLVAARLVWHGREAASRTA